MKPHNAPHKALAAMMALATMAHMTARAQQPAPTPTPAYAPLHQHPHPAPITTLYNDGDSLLWMGDAQGRILVRHWHSGAQRAQWPHAHRGRVSAIDIHPATGRVATASHDGTVAVWTRTGTLLRRFTNPTIGPYATWQGHEVTTAHWTPTGDSIHWGGYNAQVYVGSPATGTQTCLYRDPQAGIAAGHPSPQGYVVAAGTRLLQIRPGQPPHTLAHAPAPICELRPGPQPHTWLCWTADGTLRALDTHTGTQAWALPSQRPGSAEFAAPPAQPYCLTAGHQTPTLWHTHTQQPLQRLHAHAHPVRTVATATDMRYLATADSAGLLIVWQRTIPLPTHPATGAAPQTVIRHRLQSPTGTLSIQLWDHQVQDGDSISLYLDGVPILAHHALTNQKHEVRITIPPHRPCLLALYAHNQGRVGPNTAAIRILGHGIREQFTLASDLATASAAELLYQPQ